MQFGNFGLSELNLRLLENKNGRINRFPLGTPHNFFAMILEGHARFLQEGTTVELSPFELLYIPQGLAYTSEWHGSPTCRFYSLSFGFESPTENARFALQKLPVSSLAPLGICAADFHTAIEDKSDGRWGTLALFICYTAKRCRFYSPLRPLPFHLNLCKCSVSWRRIPQGNLTCRALHAWQA